MIIEIGIIILALPIGYLIAWLGRDELIMGRPYFIALMSVVIIELVIFLFSGFIVGVLTSVFIGTVALIGLMKSYDHKWTSSIYTVKTHKKRENERKR